MKVCVTGGCGFIGSHVVDILVKNGHDVVVYDNLSTGSVENLHTDAELYTGDISDRTELDSFFRYVHPDAVIHHAAQIDVQTSMKNPAYDANVNIMGTVNLLDMCSTYGVKRFIYASSAAIYGNPDYLGVDEEHPKNPESFYGYSKLVPETYIRMISDDCDMTYGILRYANVYGPRQKAEGEGAVVTAFAVRMKRNEACSIFGDGEQTRDFVYVKDIARANLLALENTDNLTVNVSTAEPTSVNTLFETMKNQYRYNMNPVYGLARHGDIVHSWLTNDKIIDMLGWKPSYDLESGIREMANTND